MPSPETFRARVVRDYRPRDARYSVAQMDDFLAAFAEGLVKPSGVMNLFQHLYIADALRGAANVLEFCCGRGLLLPFMVQRSAIQRYVGVDIAIENFASSQYRRSLEPTSQISFVSADVTEISRVLRMTFDAVVYTSAVEHLDETSARASLEEAALMLKPGGRLYLSTPHTPSGSTPPVQYKVHVFEWDQRELAAFLHALGFEIVTTVGLLPDRAHLRDGLVATFGVPAAAWFDALDTIVPRALLDPIMAACLPDVSTEVLFVCEKKGDRG